MTTAREILDMIENANSCYPEKLKEIDAKVEAYRLGATFKFEKHLRTGSYGPDYNMYKVYVDSGTFYEWHGPPIRFTLSFDKQEEYLGPVDWKADIALHSDIYGDYYVCTMSKDRTCIRKSSPDPYHGGMLLSLMHARIQAVAHERGEQ